MRRLLLVALLVALPVAALAQPPAAPTGGKIGPSVKQTLTVTKPGGGTGTVTGTGITCGPDCSQWFTAGAVVTLTASTTTGNIFTGWSGGGCSDARVSGCTSGRSCPSRHSRA